LASIAIASQRVRAKAGPDDRLREIIHISTRGNMDRFVASLLAMMETERAVCTSLEARRLCGCSLFQPRSRARAFAYRADPDARAIADLHQGAAADPLSVDHDVDRLIARRP
jgi:hypothetical protein